MDSRGPKVVYNVMPPMLNAFAAFVWNMGYESIVILDLKGRDYTIGDLRAFM